MSHGGCAHVLCVVTLQLATISVPCILRRCPSWSSLRLMAAVTVTLPLSYAYIRGGSHAKVHRRHAGLLSPLLLRGPTVVLAILVASWCNIHRVRIMLFLLSGNIIISRFLLPCGGLEYSCWVTPRCQICLICQRVAIFCLYIRSDRIYSRFLFCFLFLSQA